MKTCINYNCEYLLSRIRNNKFLIESKQIDYIYYIIQGFENMAKNVDGLEPEKTILEQFRKYLMNRFDEQYIKFIKGGMGTKWYTFIRIKAIEMGCDEVDYFYELFDEFEDTYRGYDCIPLKISDESIIEINDLNYKTLYYALDKHSILVDKRKAAFVYYDFLGSLTYLYLNHNVKYQDNSIYKFGIWLNKLFKENGISDNNEYWYLGIEEMAFGQNKDELEILTELLDKYLREREFRYYNRKKQSFIKL